MRRRRGTAATPAAHRRRRGGVRRARGRRSRGVRQRATGARARRHRRRAFGDVNYVFPTFVTTHMPIGLVGLIIAAIFAASMSTVAAELNSLATATVIDFYKRLFVREADRRALPAVAKIATAFWGVFACVVALFAANLGPLIDVVNRFGSFFYGSILGVFVLALGVPRATVDRRLRRPDRRHGRGRLRSRPTPNIAFLWHNVVGAVTVVVVGGLVSLVTQHVTLNSAAEAVTRPNRPHRPSTSRVHPVRHFSGPTPAPPGAPLVRVAARLATRNPPSTASCANPNNAHPVSEHGTVRSGVPSTPASRIETGRIMRTASSQPLLPLALRGRRGRRRAQCVGRRRLDRRIRGPRRHGLHQAHFSAEGDRR